MAKILGLDLGTNSIGWAIVEYFREKNIQFKLLDRGVLVFDAGVSKNQKGNYKSKTADRREKRSPRKLKLNIKKRKYKTLEVLSKYKMCPLVIDESINEVEQWKNSNFTKYPLKPEFIEWLKTDDSTGRNPYYLRDKASKEKVTLLELGRAFYHIAQRRGFLSNRLDQSDDSKIENVREKIKEIVLDEETSFNEIIEQINDVFVEYDFDNKTLKDLDDTEKKLNKIRKYILDVLNNKVKEKTFKNLKEKSFEIQTFLDKIDNMGPVKKDISILSKKIESGGFKTLGQYFYSLYNKEFDVLNTENETVATIERSKIRKHYTSREEHYLFEFEEICKTQKLDGININEKSPEKRYLGIVRELYKAIFYQRPLKSQKGQVGYCTLQTNKKRCALSRPEFEEFRMLAFISNIKIKTPSDERLRFLNENEREKITSRFLRKSKPTFNFSEIVTALIPENKNAVYYKDDDAKNAEYIVNYKLNTTVYGCPTSSNLKFFLGNDWKSFKIVTDKLNSKGHPINYDYNDIWHVWETYTSKQKLKEFAIENLGFKEEQAIKFSNVSLKKGYSNLSVYALDRINNGLRKGLDLTTSIFMANIDKVVNETIWQIEDNINFISTKINNLIEKNRENKKIYSILNSELFSIYDKLNEEKEYYSKEAESLYRKDLLKRFEESFGKITWSELDEKDILFENSFGLFINALKSRTSIKIKSIEEEISEFLLDNDLCSDERKLKNLYHPSDIEKFKPATLKDKNGNLIIDENGKPLLGLGSPLSTSIKNPMAMKTIHQLKKLINELIKDGKVDSKTTLHIELAREMNDNNKRIAISRWQEDRKKLKEIYKEKIQELYHQETGNNIDPNEEDIQKFQMVLEQRKDKKIIALDDILKYQLWEEQNHVCLYTGKTIRLSSFLGGKTTFDIEHTLPRSMTTDNSMENKTLADEKFNREIKIDKIPFELDKSYYDAILPRISHWKKRYEYLNGKIEELKKNGSKITDVDKKNKNIQERHYLKMEYDYWYGKYSRFTQKEIKSGFKNSQLVDTGLITSFAQAYLKSYFKNVVGVKGNMTNEFRKIWNIQESFIDENQKKHFKEKNRDNHVHHCIDAVVLACMTKDKYDLLASAWGEADKGEIKKAENFLKQTIPWDSFAKDVKALNKTVLVKHINKDVVKTPTIRLVRKNGNILYQNEISSLDGKPIPKKGKQLNDNEIIGKIKNEDYFEVQTNSKKTYFEFTKDKKNKISYEKKLIFKNGKPIPLFGKKLNENEIIGKTENRDYFVIEQNESRKIYSFVFDKNKNIVYRKEPIKQASDSARGSLHEDNFVGAILQPEYENGKPKHDKNGAFILQKDKDGNAQKFYVIRKELSKISKLDIPRIVDKNIQAIIEKNVQDGIISFKKIQDKEVVVIKEGHIIWQNEAKKIPIFKIRVKVKDTPIEIKNQQNLNLLTDKANRKIHKHTVYAMNDKNYCMAIYDLKGKREFELINNFDVYNLLKKEPIFYPLHKEKIHKGKKVLYPIAKRNNRDIILKKGLQVIFYDKSLENPKDITDIIDFQGRVYIIEGLSINRVKSGKNFYEFGVILLRDFKEARKADDIKKDDFKPDGDFKLGECKPTRKMSPGQFTAFVEGIDFKVLPSGKIEKI